MTGKKIFIKLFILFFSIQASFAKDFEGTLTMVKHSLYDSSEYLFTVKGNWVRLDIKNKGKEIIQTLVINLETSKIIALSQNLKLYTNISLTNGIAKKNEDFKVTPTGNNKLINGYKCFQWRIRNENLNTEVTYWVCESDLSFFQKVTTLLNNTDDYKNLFEYFIQISPKPGYIPILAEEWTLLREEKSKMMVSGIKPKEVNPKVFQVPSDYKLLRI